MTDRRNNLFSSLTKHPNNPVFSRGEPGRWDEEDVLDPVIIKKNDKFSLLYRGQAPGESTYSFGLATSTDLINWEKHSENPVFSEQKSTFGMIRSSILPDQLEYLNKFPFVRLTEWDDFRIQVPSLIKNESMYHLFYHGSSGRSASAQIGHATSNNLIKWSRNKNNPVISWGSNGSWDETAINDSTIFKYQGTYYLFYGGYNGYTHQIGYATSDDLKTWKKFTGNPVLSPSQEWEDGTVREPRIVLVDDTFHMMYRGGSGGSYKIGYATSTDLENWNRNNQNPVLSSEAGWESQEIRNATLIKNGKDWHVLYSGYDGSNWGIGMAVAE